MAPRTKKRDLAPGGQAAQPTPSGPVGLNTQGWDAEVKARLVADLTTDGLFTNAELATDFAQHALGAGSAVETTQSLRAAVTKVHSGDLRGAETMLMSQAVALNSLFANLAVRSGRQLGINLDVAERYMRLALKAQGQCRATLETLAAIKNPPVVFARQANINNGGQQQVNNGAAVATPASSPAPASNDVSRPNELLGASDGQWLDTATQGAASGAHPDLAPVGGVNGSEVRRRQGE